MKIINNIKASIKEKVSGGLGQISLFLSLNPHPHPWYGNTGLVFSIATEITTGRCFEHSVLSYMDELTARAVQFSMAFAGRRFFFFGLQHHLLAAVSITTPNRNLTEIIADSVQIQHKTFVDLSDIHCCTLLLFEKKLVFPKAKKPNLAFLQVNATRRVLN